MQIADFKETATDTYKQGRAKLPAGIAVLFYELTSATTAQPVIGVRLEVWSEQLQEVAQ